MSGNLALPKDWDQTNIFRHLANPYSDDALAELRQDIIDVGPIDFSELPQEMVNYGLPYTIKTPGQPFTTDTQNPVYDSYHEGFIDVATQIAGEDVVLASEIRFRHNVIRTLAVGEGPAFNLPHIDGKLFEPESPKMRYLQFFGIAISAVPTKVVQGGYCREDLHMRRVDDEYDYIYKPVGELAKKQLDEAEEIPVGRLVILGPVAVHFAQKAKKPVPRRHLTRWSLLN